MDNNERYPSRPLKQHVEPGQITYYEFLMKCEAEGRKPRPITAFEPGSYLGPSRTESSNG